MDFEAWRYKHVDSMGTEDGANIQRFFLMHPSNNDITYLTKSKNLTLHGFSICKYPECVCSKSYPLIHNSTAK
jgi:hypothetical protein